MDIGRLEDRYEALQEEYLRWVNHLDNMDYDQEDVVDKIREVKAEMEEVDGLIGEACQAELYAEYRRSV